MGLYQDHVMPHLGNLSMQNRQLAPCRKRILAQAEGRVLEIGVGSGTNLPLYTERTKGIVGVEPHPKLLSMVRGKQRHIPMKLIEGSANASIRS